MRGYYLLAFVVLLLALTKKELAAQRLLTEEELEQTEVFSSLDEALLSPNLVYQLDLLTSDLKV